MKLTLNCLVSWINKTRSTEVKLIRMNCIYNHFTAQSNGIVWDISVRYQRSSYFFGCCYCDLCLLCAYGEWVFVARVTPSWRRTYCHLAWTWSNSTYWSTVDDHIKNCVWTSHNLVQWRHFLARPLARSVGLWFLFVGLQTRTADLGYREFLTKSMLSHQPCYFA